MPHAVFNLGPQTASVDAGARVLIPGVEPGGSRAGEETKPALLIRDAWIQLLDYRPTLAAGIEAATVFLKLSQEIDLTPGLLLGVAQVASFQATAVGATSLHINDLFHAHGTVWAPRVVGVRFEEVGAFDAFDMDLHLDYEVVDVPWMDWFIMWDFLDNIVDNEREY